MAVTSTKSKHFNPLSLDAINFLLADVRGALGPYLNVFLVTQQHWSQSQVGLVTTISGLLGLAVQTPIGAAIDETRAKRGVIVLALVVLGIGAVIIFAWPSFWPVAAREQPDGSRRRRLRSCNRGPNVGPVRAAATCAANGTEFGVRSCRQCRDRLGGRRGRLCVLPTRGVPAGAGFRRADDDRGAVHSRQGHRLQQGERPGDEPGAAESPTAVAGYSILFKSRPLVIFGLCVMLFHFANAPLLPLVGQKLAAAYPKEATAMMSTCIIAAQGVMLPIALLVGYKADTWGRKPLFLVGFAILPIRAVLYTLSDNSFWLIGVQLLDGVGAGIFGALAPLVIADIMRGTGRYNLAQGAIATVQGIGASLSGLAAGEIVDHFGYSATFLALGAAALVAFVVFFLQMPETAEPETASPGS